jgi:hypothetical protein
VKVARSNCGKVRSEVIAAATFLLSYSYGVTQKSPATLDTRLTGVERTMNAIHWSVRNVKLGDLAGNPKLAEAIFGKGLKPVIAVVEAPKRLRDTRLEGVELLQRSNSTQKGGKP